MSNNGLIIGGSDALSVIGPNLHLFGEVSDVIIAEIEPLVQVLNSLRFLNRIMNLIFKGKIYSTSDGNIAQNLFFRPTDK